MNPYKSVLEGENFTWVYINVTPKTGWRVCFQWLRYQGSEFNIKCGDKAEANKVINQLKMKYNPEYKSHIIDKHTIWERKSTAFETEEATILPEDIVLLLGEEYREKITITFTSLKSNNFTENMNFNRMYPQ